MSGHRKRVKHSHEPGDLHELTFSCDRQMKLLSNDRRRAMLAESIDRAIQRCRFQLVAFVFMPEYVYLLAAKPTGATRRTCDAVVSLSGLTSGGILGWDAFRHADVNAGNVTR